jgi:D-alanyl-D-alanine carboxypeptidase
VAKGRRLLPPRQQHQLESLVSKATGKPIRRTTAADPAGYGLGVQQVFNPQTGIFWAYEGQAFGARVIHYFMATALNCTRISGSSSAETRSSSRSSRS